MPTYPKPTPEDFIRLSELTEALEDARNELAREVFRLFPKSHPASRYLSDPKNLGGLAARLKSGLEDSAARWLGPSAPAVSLFYGPDRQRARDQITPRTEEPTS